MQHFPGLIDPFCSARTTPVIDTLGPSFYDLTPLFFPELLRSVEINPIRPISP